MNSDNARRVLAQTAIIAAAAAGAWHIGLRPFSEGVARAEATLAADRAEIAAYQAQRDIQSSRDGQPGGHASRDTQIRNPHGIINDVELRTARLLDLSARSGHTAALYDLLGGLASRAGVAVERIDPKGSQTPIKDKEAKAGQSVAGSVYSIEVTGPYDRIATFLGLLQNDAGLTKVVTFRIVPAAESTDAAPQTVKATIETAHYRLVADQAQAPADTAGGKP